jgi:dTDP-4-amino-4,6-dideoxygalactose transaminase
MIPIAKPLIDQKDKQRILDILDSGLLAQGKMVEEFEEAFARFIGVKHAIATNSGTSALHTALASAGIGPGDEIITTTFSFIASATCVLMQGATPVLCDIDPDTYNISLEALKQKITSKTKAIIPVHLYGHPCDMDPLLALAEDHDLLVIEDACQAHGALYKKKPVGSFGDMGTFSFYPTKNITTGEGGIITTNDDTFAEKARMFRNHGQSSRYKHEFLGYNYRLTNLAAALGLGKLEKIQEITTRRRQNASLYTKGFSEINGIHTPIEASYAHHVYHQYTIDIKNSFPLSRDEVITMLQKKGIGYGVYYHTPLHIQPLLKEYSQGKFPVADEKATIVLSLPVHPGVSSDDITFIVDEFATLGGEK